MTNIDIKKSYYMPGLDGLRALAVFAVIAYHLGLPFVPGGFLGVTLFFVLSGYLITDLLFSEWAQEHTINLKSFFARRAKRLLPSVFFMLICILAYVTVFRPELLTNLKSDILPAAFFFSNWWYIFQEIPYFTTFAAPSVLNHFWSLAVEVQFYLVWPVVLLIVQRFIQKKWIKLAITAAAAVLSAALMAVLYQPGFDPSRIYYGTDTRVFSLLLGACLAIVYPSMKIAGFVQKRAVRIISDIAGFAGLLMILFMTYYITQYDDFLYRGGMFVFSIASLLLIAAAANPMTIIGKVFSIKPLRFIGKISYGVYLWQFPVIVLTNSMFHLNKVSVTLSILQVAATILLATISYYLIEKPIRQNNISKSLKKNSFREFCAHCRHTSWRTKTASLLVLTLVLITGIGFLNAQAVLDNDLTVLSALPSQVIIAPSDNTDASSAPAPSAEPSGSSSSAVPQSNSQVNTVPGSEPTFTSQAPDASASPPDSAQSEIIPNDLIITVIGDSIAIDIAPYLQEYYPNMRLDAEVGRQFYQAKNVITQLLQKNELGSTVVIELGSNGAFSEAHMRALIELIGSDRKIIFINTQVPRPWCLTVNSTLSNISAEYANTTVADWYSASVDKSDYFYKDGFHPNKTGSPILAKVVSEAIDEVQPYKPYMPLN